MIRGTTHDQDARFCDKTKKMLEKSQWPDKYDIKIDLTKIDLELVKVWIQKHLIKLLGEEDDIISGTVLSLIDQSVQKEQKLNAKLLHVAMSGFLQDKTLTFVSELWNILDEAQRSSRGIPECLLQQKKKSEDLHRKRLDQLNAKKYKINNNKFNQNIRNQPRRYRRESEQKGRRERSRDREQKKKKHRQRHRSRSHHKKRRSRSHSRQRRHKKSVKQSKQRHRRSRSSQNQHPRRKERRQPSNSSDSSGVLSSSSSNKN